jgi:hypothetical protein
MLNLPAFLDQKDLLESPFCSFRISIQQETDGLCFQATFSHYQRNREQNDWNNVYELVTRIMPVRGLQTYHRNEHDHVDADHRHGAPAFVEILGWNRFFDDARSDCDLSTGGDGENAFADQH